MIQGGVGGGREEKKRYERIGRGRVEGGLKLFT